MQQSTLLSSDQKTALATYLIQPEGEVRAMVQIAHGMCEYFLRYRPFGEFLAKKGVKNTQNCVGVFTNDKKCDIIL